ARAGGIRTVLAVPLLREGAAIGAIALSRLEVRPFTDQQIALVRTFADQAVIALENTRLFTELQERLEEQTATAAILRAIAGSPTDLDAVVGTVAEPAARLCEAGDATIARLEGDRLRRVAHYGPLPIAPGAGPPLDRGGIAGRAAVDRVTVQVADMSK